MDMYDRIDSTLRSLKLTRKGMCEKLGIPYGTLNSLIQRRSMDMKTSMLNNIADYLKVSGDWLITGKEKADDKMDMMKTHAPDDVDMELYRVSRRLSIKGKTLLLSYAYTLEDKESTK